MCDRNVDKWHKTDVGTQNKKHHKPVTLNIKPLIETIVILVKTLGHELPQLGDQDAIPTIRLSCISGPPSSPRQKSSVDVVTAPIVQRLL